MNNNKEVNNDTSNDTSQLLTSTEAIRIVNQVYGNAYDKIEEGQKLVDTSTAYSKNDAHNSLKCYKINFSTITDTFTNKGLSYIEHNFSDPVEGDNNYYTCSASDNDTYSSNFPKLMNTIFGVTDQGKRNLTIVAITADTIVATGQLNQRDQYPLYIIFKKSNNNWLIDSFE